MKDSDQLPIEFCFVTWVTHNSRLSERMVDVLPAEFIKGMRPLILDIGDQMRIGQLLAVALKRYSLSAVTFNILPDHVHVLVAAFSEEELSLKIGNVKGYTAHAFRKEKKKKSRIWARKFNRQWIENENHLNNVVAYIDQNHKKHEASWGRDFLCGFGLELKDLVGSVCISAEEIRRYR